MKNDVPIKNNIVIPGSEIEITTSRSSGPGGQHVNKTDSRISVRWNALNTTALDEYQRNVAVQNLQSQLTESGDIIVHYSASRSQNQNKQMALAQLAHIVRKALFVPKKRVPTKVSKNTAAKRLQSKMRHSVLKKNRSSKGSYE
jgi:ribosome-associated protein